MRALIVVESWFGNTRAVAGAVAEGLGRFMTVDIRNVDDAPAQLAEDVDLVVVGGPTHALGMSRPSSRLDAAQQAGVTTGTEGGVREWLASAPTGIQRAAAFDTRITKRWGPGAAARGIAQGLRKLGAPSSPARSPSWSRGRPVHWPRASVTGPASGASSSPWRSRSPTAAAGNRRGEEDRIRTTAVAAAHDNGADLTRPTAS